MNKDKIEVSHSWGRYELNNFYDSAETDCTNLTSKLGDNYQLLKEENHLIRDTLLKFYEIAYRALQRNCEPPYPVMLNQSIFQKPFTVVNQDVEMAYLAVINQFQNVCRLKELSSFGGSNISSSNLIIT